MEGGHRLAVRGRKFDFLTAVENSYRDFKKVDSTFMVDFRAAGLCHRNQHFRVYASSGLSAATFRNRVKIMPFGRRKRDRFKFLNQDLCTKRPFEGSD